MKLKMLVFGLCLVSSIGFSQDYFPKNDGVKVANNHYTALTNATIYTSPTEIIEKGTGNTNHAEVVKLDFDPKIISYEKILGFFFEIHDPTTLNSQGPDFGTQYRSEIFYLNDKQKKISENAIKKINSSLSGKVVTKSSLLKNYCLAEEYHQRYLEKK